MIKKYPLSRRSNLVVQELNGEVLIYDLSINKAVCLNETSALVWTLCDGKRSVNEISQELGKKLNLPGNEDLVWFALDQLKKENLISNSEDIISNFQGMSRREVIRKVGFATMIALPLITSMVAPTAAHAASGCVRNITENQFCTSSCQCLGRSNGAGGFFTSTCCQISNADTRLVCREVPGSAICAP